jgi:uncharacterized membrane protein
MATDYNGSGESRREKLKEGISKIQSKTNKIRHEVEDSIKSETNYNIYSALGYIPFVGWIIPYFFKKKSVECQFHARQSAVLTMIFIIIMAIVWILNNMPILSHILSLIGIKAFLVPAITYSATVLFIVVSGLAAYYAYHSESWEIPFLPKIREFLSNLFRNDLEGERKQSNKPKG